MKNAFICIFTANFSFFCYFGCLSQFYIVDGIGNYLLKTTLLSKKSKTSAAKMISDVYSYKQVMRYLAKYKMVKVGDSDKWVPCQTVKYISELVAKLGI